MAVMKMTQFVTDQKDNRGPKQLLEFTADARVRGGIIRYAQHVVWPISPPSQAVRPLVFQHREVIGNRIDAVAGGIQPRVGQYDVAQETKRGYREDNPTPRPICVEIHRVGGVFRRELEAHATEAALFVGHQSRPDHLTEILFYARPDLTFPCDQSFQLVKAAPDGLRRPPV